MSRKSKAKKLKVKPAKKTGRSTSGSSVVTSIVGAGTNYITGGSSKKRSSGTSSKKKTAKQMLKAAYERKAKFNIRVGNLGQARRLLRKKTTVV